MDMVNDVPNVIHVPTSCRFGGAYITAGDGIHYLPIIGQPDTPQLPALILGIDNVHPNRWEQAL